MLLASAGFDFCQMDFGTTPNIAPPSSLKNPVLITCKFKIEKLKIQDWKLHIQNSRKKKEILNLFSKQRGEASRHL
jgi:hypothetical protein